MPVPNPRFAEYGYQLMLMEEHAGLLEHHHPAMIEAGKQRLRSELDADDESARALRSRLESALEDGVVTRFLMGSTLIGAWAIFEEAVTDLADFVYWQQEPGPRFEDVHGEFVSRAARYFTDVLRFESFASRADVDRLRNLALLRGLITHAHGRLSLMSAKREPFERWLRQQPDVSVVSGDYVVIGSGFVKRSLAFLRVFLSRVVDEAG